MASYTVNHVEERPSIGQGGNLVNTTVIFLETTMGARGSLEISTANYSALMATEEGKQALREMLQDKAEALDAPFSL
jgi:DNA-binding FadR family transcriptional regulator